ncbi:hypothetical protein HYALB_00011838 [Hymenoscyphus albidus]|uniref:DUF676 domain-containing protein n=1 Tax=Hymenoscyphus albidus TaxID=595503 RepID=A0A9N9LVK6_9HELO|nr:hypothetical protein HYALB_00011838 [Hymenoscyphus albidus]
MLLIYQTGSVKIGEVIRYTVTYTPAHDRILPSPTHLFLRIKNTSAIALRAAFVHGPYTLYTSAYPATFNPNEKFENPRRYGVPEFEPNLKAGGTFSTQLAVPDHVRESAGSADRHGKDVEGEEAQSVSWIVEVSSQVIFSTSAAVHYEVLIGRDEKSLNLGFSNPLTGGNAPTPGQVSDHQQSQGAKDGHHAAQPKGIYSKAVKLRVDDTASLWNTPPMPEWPRPSKDAAKQKSKDAPVEKARDGPDDAADTHRFKRQKKIHLVILTHGLHGNLGADMLYMKESIDATARQGKIDAKARRAKRREERRKAEESLANDKSPEGESSTGGRLPSENKDDDSDEEEEEIVVRGFSGNATRTERGIKYLGKRLAKYVLAMTYPDQPFRPISKKTAAEAISHAARPTSSHTANAGGKGPPTHNHSTIHKAPDTNPQSAYVITSISFIAHSLGGLVQTYAVAYIQKHSPEFFDKIKPINFVALASPFLGLSNENPLYVKFALDFGLVGRTGQDLGLTWRAPTIARSGWGAIVGGIGENAQKLEGQNPPESKPLLRILPTGPAHTVLKKFKNRTVYSNVVNDGIVPLRTSCLLFLDWQGLGRVEKARRENGLVGTVAGWGWAELTGQNTVSPMARTFSEAYDNKNNNDGNSSGNVTPTFPGHGDEVPQPPPYATQDDNRSVRASFARDRSESFRSTSSNGDTPQAQSQTDGPFSSFVKFFQPSSALKTTTPSKHSKIYHRSQTLKIDSSSAPTIMHTPSSPRRPASAPRKHGKATAGHSDDEDHMRVSAPPKTTFFEAAGDILKPPLPSAEYMINPESRPRAIFHDRIYHPSDIPPPPLKKRPTNGSLLTRRSTSNPGSPGINRAFSGFSTASSTHDYDDTKNTNPDKDPHDVIDASAMKVEEKIARAYHRDLSWRKVLVSLEPDAHNNMIVRRMFANAYGWPVVKHLCETHFSDAAVANVPDAQESNEQRAKGEGERPDAEGNEVKGIDKPSKLDRTESENREATDHVPSLLNSPKPTFISRCGNESEGWGEREWMDSADESDDFEDSIFGGPGSPTKGKLSPREKTRSSSSHGGTGWVTGGAGWNWTEAIAGKGASARAGSPRGTSGREVDAFLGKGRVGSGEGERKGSLSPLATEGRGRVGSGDGERKGSLSPLATEVKGLGISTPRGSVGGGGGSAVEAEGLGASSSEVVVGDGGKGKGRG